MEKSWRFNEGNLCCERYNHMGDGVRKTMLISNYCGHGGTPFSGKSSDYHQRCWGWQYSIWYGMLKGYNTWPRVCRQRPMVNAQSTPRMLGQDLLRNILQHMPPEWRINSINSASYMWWSRTEPSAACLRDISNIVTWMEVGSRSLSDCHSNRLILVTCWVKVYFLLVPSTPVAPVATVKMSVWRDLWFDLYWMGRSVFFFFNLLLFGKGARHHRSSAPSHSNRYVHFYVSGYIWFTYIIL